MANSQYCCNNNNEYDRKEYGEGRDKKTTGFIMFWHFAILHPIVRAGYYAEELID